MSTSTKRSFSLKLLIDPNENRVVYAEADKDFVDFLFSLMSLPIGTVTSLLSPQEMAGSLGNVYQSLEDLSDTYVQPNADKTALLRPNVSALERVGVAKLMPLLVSSAPAAKPLYSCYRCSKLYVTDDPYEWCPRCDDRLSNRLIFLPPKASQASASSSGGGRGGYVKDMVTYMVTDDLKVTPMSTISTITLIKQLAVRDVDELVVSIGMDEGLKLLKASFETKTVLSDVFLA